MAKMSIKPSLIEQFHEFVTGITPYPETLLSPDLTHLYFLKAHNFV